jgi:hypothetical protein
MATSKNKTVETSSDPKAFISSLIDGTKKKDSLQLIKIFEEASGFKAKMWGPSIIGFGSYHYVYDSGREGDAPLVGFSPRKADISLYLSGNFKDREALLKKFGKHKTGKACIYVKQLEEVDVKILEKMIKASMADILKRYPQK